MSLITAEMRAAQIQAQADFETAAEAGRRRMLNELKANLTVAERLMRRVEMPRFKTIFSDDLGDIVIETRLMTSAERALAVEINGIFKQSDKDDAKYAEAIDGFRELVKSITLTKGMSEFYDSPLCSDDVIISVVSRTFRGSMKLAGGAFTSFRTEQHRSGLPEDMDRPGPKP